MKRDMDLVRKIAFAIEAEPKGYVHPGLQIEGYDEDVVGFHVLLMMEAGLIEGGRMESRCGPIGLPHRLKWLGHEFVAAARNDTIWNKAKEKAKEKGLELGAMGFAGVVTYLRHLIGEQLGVRLG